MERGRNSRFKDWIIGAGAASALWLGIAAYNNWNDDVVYRLQKSDNHACYKTPGLEQLFCNPEGNGEYFLPLESFISDGTLNEHFLDFVTRYPHQIDPKTALVKDLEIRVNFVENPKKLYGLE